MLQINEFNFPVILKFGTVYLLFSLWTVSGAMIKSIGFEEAFSPSLGLEIKYENN